MGNEEWRRRWWMLFDCLVKSKEKKEGRGEMKGGGSDGVNANGIEMIGLMEIMS